MYHIRQNTRGGKLSRLDSKRVIRGKTFAVKNLSQERLRQHNVSTINSQQVTVSSSQNSCSTGNCYSCIHYTSNLTSFLNVSLHFFIQGSPIISRRPVFFSGIFRQSYLYQLFSAKKVLSNKPSSIHVSYFFSESSLESLSKTV